MADPLPLQQKKVLQDRFMRQQMSLPCSALRSFITGDKCLSSYKQECVMPSSTLVSSCQLSLLSLLLYYKRWAAPFCHK